jgi:hypothetical protein
MILFIILYEKMNGCQLKNNCNYTDRQQITMAKQK